MRAARSMRDGAEPFDPVESVIEDIRAGKMVIVTDDEDRENEGDLIMAAEKATPAAVNFIVKHARGRRQRGVVVHPHFG
ncbi:MAG: 3,4-dihydroxy-2-butanone-4-phosphate synthase, partial [Verrucomicrobiae bacterium]|nr:3,4-dihydroxy-2-butanone-4-phosphate synthase [Verrucomicrobiae bacterium]